MHHRESARAEWAGHRRFRARSDPAQHGALWDALWLQSSRWYSLRLFGRHWRMALAAILSLSVAIAATVIGSRLVQRVCCSGPRSERPGSLLLIHARTPARAIRAGVLPGIQRLQSPAPTSFPRSPPFPTRSPASRSRPAIVAGAGCGDPGLEQLLPRARRHSARWRADTPGLCRRTTSSTSL